MRRPRANRPTGRLDVPRHATRPSGPGRLRAEQHSTRQDIAMSTEQRKAPDFFRQIKTAFATYVARQLKPSYDLRGFLTRLALDVGMVNVAFFGGYAFT